MGVHRAARRGWSCYPGVAAAAAVLFVAMGVLAATPAAAATGTYVRLAQLTEDMPGTELVVSSVSDPRLSVMIPGVAYGAVSEYRRIEPGAYVISVRPAGSAGPPLVSTTLDARAGSAYTLAAVSNKSERGLTVLIDDLTLPAAGQTRLRVINAAAAPQLDVRGPAGEPFASNLQSGTASGYQAAAAGSVLLTVGPSGGPSTAVPITVGANQVVSVVVTTRNGSLAATVLVDAGGPAAVPPGAVNAGFGGSERPDRTAAVVVFLTLAAAAGALSTHLARRTRRAQHRC